MGQGVYSKEFIKMIKIIKTKWECKSCGKIFYFTRTLSIDNYTRKIEILKPERCPCGAKKNCFILDLNVGDYEFEENGKSN